MIYLNSFIYKNKAHLLMSTTKCPECDRSMNFDYSTRKMACKSCGLFLSRDELVNLIAACLAWLSSGSCGPLPVVKVVVPVPLRAAK